MEKQYHARSAFFLLLPRCVHEWMCVRVCPRVSREVEGRGWEREERIRQKQRERGDSLLNRKKQKKTSTSIVIASYDLPSSFLSPHAAAHGHINASAQTNQHSHTHTHARGRIHTNTHQHTHTHARYFVSCLLLLYQRLILEMFTSWRGRKGV